MIVVLVHIFVGINHDEFIEIKNEMVLVNVGHIGMCVRASNQLI